MLVILKINLPVDQKRKMATICMLMISQWTLLFPWHVCIMQLIFLIHLRLQMILSPLASVSQNSTCFPINKNNYWNQSLAILIKIKTKMDLMHLYNFRLMIIFSIHFPLSFHLLRKHSAQEISWKAIQKHHHF